MKRVVVYFSFGPDGGCLVESVKSVRRVYPDVGVCVFDDSTNPVTVDVLNEIRPNLYEQTTFNRGGNLNGEECVAGMLYCFRKSIIATEADILLKVDCDTMLTRDWLDYSRPWGLQGVFFATRALVSGLCYAMDKDSPETILKAVSDKKIWEGPCPEDATIAVLSSIYLPGGVRITDSSLGHPESIAVGYNYKPGGNHNLNIFTRYPIATFGNRKGIPGTLSPDERRHIVAAKMREFNALLDRRRQRQIDPVHDHCKAGSKQV